MRVHHNALAWNAGGVGIIAIDRNPANPDREAEQNAYEEMENLRVDQQTILAKEQPNVYGLAWGSTWCDGDLADRGCWIFRDSSDNRGHDNRYFWATSGERYQWRTDHTSLTDFNATPGKENGALLTQAEKDAVVADNNLPPAPSGSA